MNRAHNRTAFAALLIGITIAVSTLVVISPLALRVIALIPNISWPELSNIGQTYGAVSALLAALALVGVAASVLMQNRELRHSRWESGRARHFEIIRMALDDPLCRQVYGARAMPENEARLEGYVNLLLEYWVMLWEFGDIQEERLRTFLEELLGSKAGHVYWQKFGSVRLHEAGTKRERTFQRIADEVYRKLGQSLPNGTSMEMHRTRLWSPSGTILGGGLLIALIAACVALFNRVMAKKGSRPLRPAPMECLKKPNSLGRRLLVFACLQHQPTRHNELAFRAQHPMAVSSHEAGSEITCVDFLCSCHACQPKRRNRLPYVPGPILRAGSQAVGAAARYSSCRYHRPQTGPWVRDVHLAVYRHLGSFETRN